MTSSKPNIDSLNRAIPIALAVLLVIGVAGYLGWRSLRMSATSRAAIQAFRERKLDDAVRDVDRWLKLEPRSSTAWFWKCRIELARDRPTESVDALQKARDLGYPQDELQVVNRIVQVFGGRYEGAEPILRKALEESSDPEPEIAQALARVYLASFQYGRAVLMLQRWMKDAPDDPKPYLWQNDIYERTTVDTNAMIRNYSEALRRDPSNAEALLGLAEHLRVLRRTKEASNEYKALLKLYPKSLPGNRGAGQVALELGETEAAIQYFNNVLSIDPKEPFALRELALLDIRAGRYEPACDRLKAAIQVDPFDPDLRFNHAKALKLAGRVKESEAENAETERLREDQKIMNDIKAQLVGNPNDLTLRLKAARWLLDHGHEKEGLQWTDLILKASPGDRDTCLFLNDYHRQKGNVGLANYYKLAATPAAKPASR